MDEETEKQIQAMDRNSLEGTLMSICIQCYDNESDETLREAIRQNILDGTLISEELY